MQTERADGPKEQIISQMLDRTPETSPVKKVRFRPSILAAIHQTHQEYRNALRPQL